MTTHNDIQVRLRPASLHMRMLSYVGCALRACAFCSFLCLFPLATACSSGDDTGVDLVLTPGANGDTFTRDPSVQQLVLRTIGVSGQTREVLNVPWPDGVFRLSGIERKQVLAFEAIGMDGLGRAVVRGATSFHALWQQSAPVPIFAGRVGEANQAGDTLPIAHENGIAALVDGHYVLSIGGTNAADAQGVAVNPSEFCVYDVAQWQSTAIRSTIPKSVKSFVMTGARHAVGVDDDGAVLLDLFAYSAVDLSPPQGFSFDEVAGGQVLYDTNGFGYVIGATRADRSSSAVLVVDQLGGMQVVRMAEQRRGASAAYVPGKGLVVASGSDSAPGVLLLGPSSSSFAPLSFGPDGTEGATMVALDASTLVLVGGRVGEQKAKVRTIDLRCTSDCEAKAVTAVGQEPLVVDVKYAKGYATGPDEVVVVGQGAEADAPTGVYRLQGFSTGVWVQHIELVQPRKGATSLALFGRTVGIVGGRSLQGQGALSMEVYVAE